jgi:hypothetical protein
MPGHCGSAQPSGCADRRPGRQESLRTGGAAVEVPTRGLDADRGRVGRRDRRLAPAHRPLDRRLPGTGPHRILVGATPSQGSITKTGNGHVRRRWDAASPTHAPAGSWPTAAFMTDGGASTRAANAPGWPTPPSPGNWPAGAGHWRSSTTEYQPLKCPSLTLVVRAAA